MRATARTAKQRMGRRGRVPSVRAHGGFTLIEMAVVLVIIAVMLVSVLQGRALIENAEYKSLKRDFAGYARAFQAFQERYDALPGDFEDAPARLGAPAATDGDEGNGVINDGPTCDAAADEACRAWQHLRAATLIQGSPGAAGTAASPAHAFGGVVSGFFTGAAGNGAFGHKIAVEGLPVEIARRLDADVDDGVCTSGAISSVSGCDGTDWDATSATTDLVYAL